MNKKEKEAKEIIDSYKKWVEKNLKKGVTFEDYLNEK